MAVSAELFRVRGFLATSIRHIGEALGLTSAALYYHFKNKDEVLLAVMRTALDVVQERVQTAIQEAPDAWSALQEAMRVHLQVSLSHQDYAIVLLDDIRHLEPDSLREVIRLRDAYEELWAGLLLRNQSAGRIRTDVDLHLLRLMLFGALNLVVTWYRPDGQYSPNEIADEFLRYTAAGILTPDVDRSGA